MSGVVEDEAETIRRLRHVAERMKGDEWAMDTDGRDFVLWAHRSTGEQEKLCTIHASALPDERRLIEGALPTLVFFLSMFERARARCWALERELGHRQAEARAKDYTTQAAMLLNDRHFQRFLDGKGCGSAVVSAATADTRLKSLLAIKSKKDLNTDASAAASWRRLTAEFEAWKRGANR